MARSWSGDLPFASAVKLLSGLGPSLGAVEAREAVGVGMVRKGSDPFLISGPSLASSSLVPFDSLLWLAFLRLRLVSLGLRRWIHGEPSSVAPPSPIDSLQAWTPWLQCGCLGWVPPLRVSASSPMGIVGLSLFRYIYYLAFALLWVRDSSCSSPSFCFSSSSLYVLLVILRFLFVCFFLKR